MLFKAYGKPAIFHLHTQEKSERPQSGIVSIGKRGSRLGGGIHLIIRHFFLLRLPKLQVDFRLPFFRRKIHWLITTQRP